ncbi:MAG: site-specific DNA-methyltransferase [Burkholderiales bacterium]|nr:site-specific DNA-methyltransferase [Burkholderiales bacterium]
MRSNKQKLELTWIGKEKRPKLEPRILLEDPDKSYHAKSRITDNDIFDNRLIFGDNLLALKALEQEFSGRVKCIFIDPPYNTGSAFTYYDDGLEHSIWLGLMRDRLEIIRRLLSDDGSLWITIDDNEVHYLKVLCDEIFGRKEFLANLVWQSKDTPGNNSTGLAQTHNHILAYRKSESFSPNLLSRNEKQISTYKNPDNDPKGPWLGTPLTRAEHRDRDYYPLRNKLGKEVLPPKGSSWRRPPDKIKQLEAEGRIYWGKDGGAEFPVEKKYLSEVKEGVVNQTWWPYEFAGSTRNASAELKGIFEGEKAFDTPKPEKLLFRVLELATNAGDLVLDSFAGSGTTGAVAHKMGRRWIMVELGDHCHTHIIPRLKKVVDGEDQGGVSESVGWQGGGGFRYYNVAPSLIVNDRWGNPVINPEYNAANLAEALCKLEGFTYAPSEVQWWQHGHSSERDFIYVTTQNLSAEQLQALSDEVGSDRSLLVCCAAFHGVTTAKASERWTNLTLKKIPKMVLARCEWGHDDYSLNVANLPMAAPTAPVSALDKAAQRKAAQQDKRTADLFGDSAEEVTP